MICRICSWSDRAGRIACRSSFDLHACFTCFYGSMLITSHTSLQTSLGWRRAPLLRGQGTHRENMNGSNQQSKLDAVHQAYPDTPGASAFQAATNAWSGCPADLRSSPCTPNLWPLTTLCVRVSARYSAPQTTGCGPSCPAAIPR